MSSDWRNRGWVCAHTYSESGLPPDPPYRPTHVCGRRHTTAFRLSSQPPCSLRVRTRIMLQVSDLRSCLRMHRNPLDVRSANSRSSICFAPRTNGFVEVDSTWRTECRSPRHLNVRGSSFPIQLSIWINSPRPSSIIPILPLPPGVEHQSIRDPVQPQRLQALLHAMQSFHPICARPGDFGRLQDRRGATLPGRSPGG